VKPRSEETPADVPEARSGEDGGARGGEEDGAAPVAPIPLLTPVPLSPPFAALDLAADRPSPCLRPPEGAGAERGGAEPGAAAALRPPPGSTPGAREAPSSSPASEGSSRASEGSLEGPAPEAVRYTGEVLRRAREARGITIAQLCGRTKILRSHMENVEADRYERLPAPVYLRGILMALAKELRLDGQRVARSYLEVVAEEAAARRKV
jgi:hypothetical protein